MIGLAREVFLVCKIHPAMKKGNLEIKKANLNGINLRLIYFLGFDDCLLNTFEVIKITLFYFLSNILVSYGKLL